MNIPEFQTVRYLHTAGPMYKQKLLKLKSILHDKFEGQTVYIAFSGGLDSRFLAYAAGYFGFDVCLFHISGPHIPKLESLAAEKWAQQHGFTIKTISINPLEIEEIRQNKKDRCYHCKRNMFIKLLSLAPSICDGTNHSDLGVYRPGLQALRELKIFSPLAEAGLTKNEIRVIGKEIGLDQPDQPSHPCSLTRFPYDFSITAEGLDLVIKLEEFLEKTFKEKLAGNLSYRVRLVEKDRYECHIQSSDFEVIPMSLLNQLKTTVAILYPDISFDIKPLEQLSGFFDRH